MTQSFDEWFDKDNHPLMDCDKWSAEVAYKAGAQSRQAEVDALSALGEMSEQKIDDLVKRNVELQKTVDKLKNNRMYLEMQSATLEMEQMKTLICFLIIYRIF